MEAFETRTLVPEPLRPFIPRAERIFFPLSPFSASTSSESLLQLPKNVTRKNLLLSLESNEPRSFRQLWVV